MSLLQVKVSQKTKDGQSFFEGTVTIPGAKPTKLVKKADQTTQFSNRSGVLTTARSLAKNLGFEGIDAADPSVTAKAAKKSVKTKSQPAVTDSENKSTKSRSTKTN